MPSQATLARIESAKKSVIDRSINPLLTDLPEKFNGFYPQQRDAIQEILEGFRHSRVVVLEGPPGSGKTVIGEVVRRILGKKCLYVCTTKALQDQFVGDFPYAKLIKGRNNYPTELYPERFGDRWESLSCGDCTKDPKRDIKCGWCRSVRSCPYESAKIAALSSPLAVANTSYLLAEANSAGRLSGCPFVIVDEGDLLENQIMSFVSLEMSEKRMERYGVQAPKLTVEEDWERWVSETLPVIKGRLGTLPLITSDTRLIRERKYLEGLYDKLLILKDGLEEGKWVYTGTKNRVEFKPVTVEEVARKYFWKHTEMVLMMSGTIISPDVRLSDLGYEEPFTFVALPSVFMPTNRPVIVKPAATMSHKDKANAWPKSAEGISSILARHNGERVLVHTVSYELARYLNEHVSGSGRQKFLYASSWEKDNTLRKFLKSKDGVLFAPSLDRGVDLANEACRVQVLAKVPYPNVGDKQVAARLYGGGRRGREWYEVETVAGIVQACGRVVRGREDYGVTYITDGAFVDLWGRSGHLFPGGRRGWWQEGLRWELN